MGDRRGRGRTRDLAERISAAAVRGAARTGSGGAEIIIGQSGQVIDAGAAVEAAGLTAL
jgi:hypothetical protein